MINYIFYLLSRGKKRCLRIMEERWRGLSNGALSFTSRYDLTSHLKIKGSLNDIQGSFLR